jgi:AAA+ ATPase superfamily predicted ATPase
MIDPEKPVEDPEQFCGQKTVVRRIFSRIGAERPQSVAVIGGIKTGKTSLLNYIAHEQTRKQHLDQLEAYFFCHVNAAEALFHDSESFVRGVHLLLSDGATADDSNYYNCLQKIVETHHKQGRKIIFLLDDFHLITSNSNFPLEFFSFLRSLANNYNLAYVTTSFLELQKLCVIKDIEESPFFNIFTNLSLGPLSEQEALELLEKLTGDQSSALEKTASWCGGFPYMLKKAAQALTENRNVSGQAPENALLPVLAPYYEKVLAILPAEALSPLKSIARDKSPDPREAHVLRPLIKQGFLLETENGIEAFAPSLNAFLRKNLSKKLLKGGS